MIKLEVGKFYRDRAGNLRCIQRRRNHPTHPFVAYSDCGSCFTFTRYGTWGKYQTEYDLIEEVVGIKTTEANARPLPAVSDIFACDMFSWMFRVYLGCDARMQAGIRDLVQIANASSTSGEKRFQALADLAEVIFQCREDISPSPSAVLIPSDPDTSRSCPHKKSGKPGRPAKR